jgi:hypothetical protein
VNHLQPFSCLLLSEHLFLVLWLPAVFLEMPCGVHLIRVGTSWRISHEQDRIAIESYFLRLSMACFLGLGLLIDVRGRSRLVWYRLFGGWLATRALCLLHRSYVHLISLASKDSGSLPTFNSLFLSPQHFLRYST